MNAHTPGPWFYEYTRIGHTVRQSPDAMSALIVMNRSENPEEDARLMAAAPELLAALQRVAESAGFQYMMHETRDVISATIAKATGAA